MSSYLVNLDDSLYVETADDETEAIRLARTRHRADHVVYQSCVLCTDVPDAADEVDILEPQSDEDTIVLDDSPSNDQPSE